MCQLGRTVRYVCVWSPRRKPPAFKIWRCVHGWNALMDYGTYIYILHLRNHPGAEIDGDLKTNVPTNLYSYIYIYTLWYPDKNSQFGEGRMRGNSFRSAGKVGKSPFLLFRSRRTKTCYSVYYPIQGRKGVSINTIGRYCRVLSQFRMFISRQNGFYFLGVSCFRFSFFSEPKNENMLKCVLPHIGQKRGIDKYNWEVLQSFVAVPYVFIVLESRVFRLSFFRSLLRTKTCYSVYYPHIGQKRGIDKYNWEVLQSFVLVPYVFIEIYIITFIVLGSRVFGFRFFGD